MKKTVITADYRRDINLLLAAMLEDSCEVFAPRNVEELLEKVKTSDCLILSPRPFENDSGEKLAREALAVRPSLQVIFITGSNEYFFSLASKGFTVLKKPLRYKEVVSLVTQ